MPEMVSWKDYEGVEGFGAASQKDVDDLNKALTAGNDQNAPGSWTAGDGFALRVESLEGVLKNTTYAMIDRFVRTGFIRSQYLSPEENKYLSQNISSCAYFFRMNRFHSDFFVCWKK